MLVLIIILTSIDASQTKLLIPTPMATETDKRLLFVECRDEQLFRIDLEAMQQQVDSAYEKLDQTLTGNRRDMEAALGALSFETDSYIIDSSYALVGQIALLPKPDVTGDDLSGVNMQALSGVVVPGWYGDLLDAADPERDLITFLVRDDSFEVFKKARALAWAKKIQAAYELLPANDPIVFGLGGTISLGQ